MPVCDAAKRFGRSAPLDPAATELAELHVQKDEGVACPPWWMPSFLAIHGQVHSGNQVAGVDVADGEPHRDLTSHQPAGQRTPADSPPHAAPSSEQSDPVRPLSFIAKGRETIVWWTASSALLCALLFFLSAGALSRKVSTNLPVHEFLFTTRISRFYAPSISCCPCRIHEFVLNLSPVPVHQDPAEGRRNRRVRGVGQPGKSRGSQVYRLPSHLGKTDTHPAFPWPRISHMQQPASCASALFLR